MEPTSRTRVRRLPKRAAYDRETINSILDAAFVCHIGFLHEGSPVVIPTGYARAGGTIYVHGSAASRMLNTLADGAPLCLTVTLVDALVLARSAFHHSINYRSVILFGQARRVEDETEKTEALFHFSEQAVPGRWAEVRPPAPQ